MQALHGKQAYIRAEAQTTRTPSEEIWLHDTRSCVRLALQLRAWVTHTAPPAGLMHKAGVPCYPKSERVATLDSVLQRSAPGGGLDAVAVCELDATSVA